MAHPARTAAPASRPPGPARPSAAPKPRRPQRPRARDPGPDPEASSWDLKPDLEARAASLHDAIVRLERAGRQDSARLRARASRDASALAQALRASAARLPDVLHEQIQAAYARAEGDQDGPPPDGPDP